MNDQEREELNITQEKFENLLAQGVKDFTGCNFGDVHLTNRELTDIILDNAIFDKECTISNSILAHTRKKQNAPFIFDGKMESTTLTNCNAVISGHGKANNIRVNGGNFVLVTNPTGQLSITNCAKVYIDLADAVIRNLSIDNVKQLDFTTWNVLLTELTINNTHLTPTLTFHTEINRATISNSSVLINTFADPQHEGLILRHTRMENIQLIKPDIDRPPSPEDLGLSALTFERSSFHGTLKAEQEASRQEHLQPAADKPAPSVHKGMRR